jgi:hypothetical protein
MQNLRRHSSHLSANVDDAHQKNQPRRLTKSSEQKSVEWRLSYAIVNDFLGFAFH